MPDRACTPVALDQHEWDLCKINNHKRPSAIIRLAGKNHQKWGCRFTIFTRTICRMNKTKCIKTQILRIYWAEKMVQTNKEDTKLQMPGLMVVAQPLVISRYLNIKWQLVMLTPDLPLWGTVKWFKNTCQLWIINDLINFLVIRQLLQEKSLKDVVSCYLQVLIYRKDQLFQCKQVSSNQITQNNQKDCKSILSSTIWHVNNALMSLLA